MKYILKIFIILLVVFIVCKMVNHSDHPIIKKINEFNPLKSYKVFTYIEIPTNFNNEKKIQLLSKNSDIPIFFKLCLDLMKEKFSNLIVLTPQNYLEYVNDFPIKMNPNSEYSLKSRVDLLCAYVLEKHGGLFLSPGTIIYDKKNILSTVNSKDFVTFGRSKFNPNSYILASKPEGDFIKNYKKHLTLNFPSSSENVLQNIINSDYLKDNFHYSGEYDGTLSKSNNKLFITDYLGSSDILFKDINKLSLISVPYEKILRNSEYYWFNNLSKEQFLDSDMYVSRLLKKLLKI